MGSGGLLGRTAVVTGASRGIGLAIAESLCAEGANVVLTARRQEHAEAAAPGGATLVADGGQMVFPSGEIAADASA